MQLSTTWHKSCHTSACVLSSTARLSFLQQSSLDSRKLLIFSAQLLTRSWVLCTAAASANQAAMEENGPPEHSSALIGGTSPSSAGSGGVQAASASTLSVTPATPDSDGGTGSNQEDGEGEAERPTLRIEVPEDGMQHLALLSAHTPIALLRRRSLERPPTPPSALLPSTPQMTSKAAVKELDAAILSGSSAKLTHALQDPAVRSVVNASLADGQFPALVAMCSLGDLPDLAKMVDVMLGAGANPKLRDTSGYTALHWAAACLASGAEVMGRLVRAGADMNAPCKEGETPLHRAARVGRAENVAWLIRSGAALQPRNKDLLAPLDVAGVFGGTVSHSHRVLVRAAMLAVRPELQTAVYTHSDCLAHIHTRDHHQEAPERILAIMEAVRGAITATDDVRLAQQALDDDAASSARERKRKSGKVRSAARVLKNTVFGDGDLRIVEDFPAASRAQVQLAHSAKYAALLWRLSRHVNKHNAPVPFTPIIQRSMHGLPRDKIKPAEMCDTSFSPGSLQAALRAAGAVVAAVEGVASGSARNALCVVRPPGHHAGVDGLIEVPKEIAPHCTSSCGFCILNSVAIGALHALHSVPGIQRVAILDIDVHHGNGTEDIINHVMEQHPELRTKLCFTSVHLYDVAPAMKLPSDEQVADADGTPSPPSTRNSRERSVDVQHTTSASSVEAFPLSSTAAVVVSTTTSTTHEATAAASDASTKSTETISQRHHSVPTTSTVAPRNSRPKRRRRAKSFDDYEVYQPTPPADAAETPLPSVPEDSEGTAADSGSLGQQTPATQATDPPLAGELPPPAKRPAPSAPVQLNPPAPPQGISVPVQPPSQQSPSRPRVVLKMGSPPQSQRQQAAGPARGVPPPPSSVTQPRPQIKLRLHRPEAQQDTVKAIAETTERRGGDTTGPPPSHPSREVDLYSFYPGTGKDDCLPHNVVNCAVQPLWRAKEGPAPLPSPLLEAAATHEQAQAASSAASKTHVAARPLGADKPHVYSTDMSPTCTLSFGAGRAAVRQAISARVVPTLRAFGPDLILLSAGFDGARGDAGNTRNDGKATQGMDLRQEDFEWITAQVMAVSRVCCPGRVVSVLEGGYGQWKLTREKYTPEDEQEGGAGGGPAPSPRSRALASPSVALASRGLVSALKTPGSSRPHLQQQHSWHMSTPGQAGGSSTASSFTTPVAPAALTRATVQGSGISIGLAPFSAGGNAPHAAQGTHVNDAGAGAAAVSASTPAQTGAAQPEAAEATEAEPEAAEATDAEPEAAEAEPTRTRLVSTLKREPLAANVLAHLKALVYA